MEKSPNPPPVNLLDRVFAILRLFLGDQPSWSISEVMAAISLPKATVHRLLREMSNHELLQRSRYDGRYRLGPLAFVLGTRSLQRHELRRLGHPILKQLADLTGETTLIFELAPAKDAMICIEQIESYHGLRLVSDIGARMPMVAGAAGQAVLAFMPENEALEIIGHGFARSDRPTSLDHVMLDHKLIVVRQNGYAHSFEETTKGACGIAAPLFDGMGAAVGAIAITAPTSRITLPELERHAKNLLEYAKILTRELGGDLNRYPSDLEAVEKA